MKNFIPLLATFVLFCSTAAQAQIQESNNTLLDYYKLNVSFTSETPENKWVAPWNNACEEASIVMVEEFYLGRTKHFSIKEAKAAMMPLFEWEDKKFGSNKDTDSRRTAQIINEYSSFQATVATGPTIHDIKQQLLQNHPVISLHYGFDLNNPNLHFRRNGSSYHMMVIIGFDNKNQEFIVHDPGFGSGLDYRYSYATIMDTLHDFDHETSQANGASVVLFTNSRMLAKTKDQPAVYVIEDNKKIPIAHSGILKNRRWSWRLVKKVEQSWLDQLETGELMQ